MSRRFKTRGGKTLKKKLKRDRRKKHITVKKMVKSRRKRNTKSRRKCNTVKKRVKPRRKYKKKKQSLVGPSVRAACRSRQQGVRSLVILEQKGANVTLNSVLTDG